MANRLEYKVGSTIGYCVLVEDLGRVMKSGQKRSMGIFVCPCGKRFITEISAVKTLHTNSCGCGYISGRKRRRLMKWEYPQEYQIWCSMKVRCYNAKGLEFKSYQGRGIKICDRWLGSFENFISDMGSRPSKIHSIDRINVNGDYEPANCRWADRYQQARNKTNTRYVCYNGIKVSMAELEERFSLKRGTIYRRLLNGFTVDEAINNHKFNANRMPIPHEVRLVLIFNNTS